MKTHFTKIRFVPSKKLKDYAGMNKYAAKSLGYPLKEDIILVDESMTREEKNRTIKHEMIERSLMKKGMTYWKAHRIALSKESD